jgi:hypothetical protein
MWIRSSYRILNAPEETVGKHQPCILQGPPKSVSAKLYCLRAGLEPTLDLAYTSCQSATWHQENLDMSTKKPDFTRQTWADEISSQDRYSGLAFFTATSSHVLQSIIDRLNLPSKLPITSHYWVVGNEASVEAVVKLLTD